MIVLAFDPGHSTGVAILNDGAATMLLSVTRTWIMREAFLLPIIEVADPDLIAIENVPSRNADTLTLAIFNHIHSTIVHRSHYKRAIRLISPGIWKPVVERAPKVPADKAFNQHSQDALGLARYALATVAELQEAKR